MMTRLAVPVSFEFFPPNTPVGSEKLKSVVSELAAVGPEFFSVTFGAGGSTRDKTLATVSDIAALGQEAAPHLSCIGSTRAGISEILATYRAQKIRRIVALRGDLPSGMASYGDFRYASELVEFIRTERDGSFHVEVACYPEVHPQSDDSHADLKHFKTKVDAGADGAITQYFYNADAYFHFVDAARAAGIEVPIVPGVMPIANFTQLKRFSDMCGAEIPRWLAKRLAAYGDDVESIREFAADVVANLCRRLIEGGAPALHFYTLNRAKATLSVIERMG